MVAKHERLGKVDQFGKWTALHDTISMVMGLTILNIYRDEMVEVSTTFIYFKAETVEVKIERT